jgi:hypothetical protein
MNRLLFLFIIIQFLAVFPSYAQLKSFKFGKVSMEELSKTHCSFDSSASAMYLFKTGSVNLRYNDNRKKWQYEYEVEFRKKIFNKDLGDHGTIKIRIYNPIRGDSKEEVETFKAYTINLIDGKIEKTKIQEKEKLETRINDYWTEISFALPQIESGSVIDYKYSIVSDFIENLRTWYYQTDIPIAYSHFKAMTPEFFQYQISTRGYYLDVKQSQTAQKEEFQFTYEQPARINSGNALPERRRSSIESHSLVNIFEVNQVPAVKDEPFMNNKEDIPGHVEFQLMTVSFPNSPTEVIAGNYEKFNKELVEHSNFGRTLLNGNFAKEIVQSLDNSSELQKIQGILQWLTGQVTWNGYKSLFTNNTGSKLLRSGEGSVADINLSLISALREAGIEAYPVILSTRGNGTVHPVYPNKADFDYVITQVILESGYILIDAASNFPLGLLPERCLNGKGWRVKKGG